MVISSPHLRGSRSICPVVAVEPFCIAVGPPLIEFGKDPGLASKEPLRRFIGAFVGDHVQEGARSANHRTPCAFLSRSIAIGEQGAREWLASTAGGRRSESSRATALAFGHHAEGVDLVVALLKQAAHASISHMTMPAQKMSTRWSAALPSSCSGAM